MIWDESPLFVTGAGAASVVGELKNGLFLAWSVWKNGILYITLQLE